MHRILTDNMDKIKALCIRHNVKSLHVFGSVCTDKFDIRESVESIETFPGEKKDFNLFLDQEKKFIKALSEYDSNVWFPRMRGSYEENVPGNWFICFVPGAWGQWKTANYGVHFDLIFAKAKDIPLKRFRLTIGVEKPFREEYRISFKEVVISRITKKMINTSGFTLKAKDRKKLLEADPIPFGPESWYMALEKYIVLKPIIDIIGEVSREYSEKGAFDSIIRFPEQ